MAYVKEHPPSEVYHLTKKENLNSILEDGMIRRFSDMECWFCVDLQKMKAYMERTVMCEGKPYYSVAGQLCRYPQFVPEDYVLLKLTPCRQEDSWYRWEQEIPAGSPAELVRAAHEFSALKIGYRGDLAFHNAEVIDVPQFLVEGVTQGEPVQTNTELWDILSQRIEDEMADYMRRLDLRTRDELIQTADEIDASPVFAPVGRFVASQGRGRVRIAAPGIWSVFGPLFGAPKAVAGEKHWRFSAPMPFTAARSADCHKGLRRFEIDADYRTPNVFWRYSL